LKFDVQQVEKPQVSPFSNEFIALAEQDLASEEFFLQ
jgi:hypothetical protein